MANTVQVEVNQVGRATSEGVVRGHRVLIDRPEAKGGDDRGAMGGELLLVSLAGCFMSNLPASIRERDADISNVRTQVSGTLDGTPTRFTAVEMHVSADTADRELLAKLVTIAERACITANTLRSALDLSVRVEA